MISKIGKFIEGSRFQNFITVLIILNAIALGLETDAYIMSHIGDELVFFDKFVLTIFTIEIFIKLVNRKANFFKNGWNIFDFIIVGISLIPSSGSLSVLRALRIFRAMRLLSVVPSMRKVVQALFLAIPGIFSVGAIILLIFYVAAVLATNFFGGHFDEWFGSVGRSMYSLFQIMTLESWSMGIVRPVMKVYPFAWAFFVIFILVTSFAVMNLFIGIIVDAMQQQSFEDQQEENETASTERSELHSAIQKLQNEIVELKELIKK